MPLQATVVPPVTAAGRPSHPTPPPHPTLQKPFLGDKEKNILLVVVPLQVLANLVGACVLAPMCLAAGC